MMGYGNWGFWQYGLMAGVAIVIFALLIWAVYAVTKTSRRPENEPQGNRPRQVLHQRLARGDVDPEEYKALRGLLTDDDVTPVDTR